MDIGYARVSTMKQGLDRQIDALRHEGIDDRYIYIDKKSGSTTNRPGLQRALDHAREGDVIVVHTLDRLGRTVRDTLNLIHDLQGREVGVRTLADPIPVDSSNPDDPMAQLAVVILSLFGQMERTYAVERAAHARAVAEAKGKRVGRPSVVDPDKLRYAEHLRNEGLSMREIVEKTGIARTTLYRYLPPRPKDTHTADSQMLTP
ncbi:recombinase family protein [Corynebacterium callunae]|nr:recombinase family protein [Corynebacterium callunae]